MSAELAALAEAFDPTPLAELERRAALPVRTDRKYVLGTGSLDALAESLAPHYAALDVDGLRVFRYDTVYFDTPTLLAYHQHLHGRRKRFKCRTRLYVDTGACAFEVKLRDGRGRTVKRRLAVEPEEHGVLGPASLAFLDGVLAEHYGVTAPDGLAPVLLTSFTRLTLVGRETPDRVTCDASLSFAADPAGVVVVPPGTMLLETKTAAAAAVADRALRALGGRPVGPCSKYCLGLALSRAELRRNRFSRVLRRHFEVVAAPAPAPA